MPIWCRGRLNFCSFFAESGVGYDLFQFGQDVLAVDDGVVGRGTGVGIGGYHRDAGDERWRGFFYGNLVELSGPVVVGSECGYEGVVANEFSCFAFVGSGSVSGAGVGIRAAFRTRVAVLGFGRVAAALLVLLFSGGLFGYVGAGHGVGLEGRPVQRYRGAGPPEASGDGGFDERVTEPVDRTEDVVRSYPRFVECFFQPFELFGDHGVADQVEAVGVP